MDLIIGSHVSFKKDTQLLGSLEEALSYGSTTFMFYTGAPQNTARSEINMNITKEALKKMSDNNIDINNVIIHAPYIINLASSDPSKHEFAVSFLKREIERAQMLNITKIVLHPGSYVDTNEEVGLNNIIDGLNEVGENKNVLICLETMAGKGTELGINFNQIKKIMDNTNYELGVCLDTCHINDAGYDITKFKDVMEEFDKIVGIDKIKCVHINDSKNIISAHKDRHENIGFGTLGFENILNVIYFDKLKGIPKILETPYVTETNETTKKVYPPYKQEIEMIRKKEFNPNLLNDIRNYYK